MFTPLVTSKQVSGVKTYEAISKLCSLVTLCSSVLLHRSSRGQNCSLWWGCFITKNQCDCKKGTLIKTDIRTVRGCSPPTSSVLQMPFQLIYHCPELTYSRKTAEELRWNQIFPRMTSDLPRSPHIKGKPSATALDKIQSIPVMFPSSEAYTYKHIPCYHAYTYKSHTSVMQVATAYMSPVCRWLPDEPHHSGRA